MEITGKRGKCWRSLKNLKSESQNTWLICGCEVRDGDFRKDIWVSILISILYLYLFSLILLITRESTSSFSCYCQSSNPIGPSGPPIARQLTRDHAAPQCLDSEGRHSHGRNSQKSTCQKPLAHKTKTPKDLLYTGHTRPWLDTYYWRTFRHARTTQEPIHSARNIRTRLPNLPSLL